MFIKWYQSLVRSFDQQKNNIQVQQKKKIMKKSSSSENEPCYSKDCKKNTNTLNKKITELSDKLFDANNMIYHYKLALAQVESRLVEYKERKKLETLKLEKDGVDGKLAGLLTASKNLDNLIKSQRSDKNKDVLGYSAVPPPPAQLYLSPKKDLSWTSLSECADDTVTDYSRPEPTVESSPDDAKKRNPSVSETEASSTAISPKCFIKFVKPNDSPSKSKTDKTETPKKPPVKYAEQYRKTNKKPTVRGNQRNWNNFKSHQLGPNFILKKMACYNCGDFNHLAYDCRKRVKQGTSRSQNNTHKSFISRPDVHKPYRPPMRPVRTNINGARPNRTSFNKQAYLYTKRHFQETTQDLMIILIQRVQRLERELKARAPIYNVDRVRSRPVMAWVPKKD
nr:ubiquitin hydrolase [Tanacetum cinerariifolium]